jgi:hypothetical protein
MLVPAKAVGGKDRKGKIKLGNAKVQIRMEAARVFSCRLHLLKNIAPSTRIACSLRGFVLTPATVSPESPGPTLTLSRGRMQRPVGKIVALRRERESAVRRCGWEKGIGGAAIANLQMTLARRQARTEKKGKPMYLTFYRRRTSLFHRQTTFAARRS